MIFKGGKEDDPNIKLFNIYAWIMENPTNTLKLQSSLCLNASSDKIKDLVEIIDQKVQKYKENTTNIGKKVSLDKNLAIHNNKNQLVVGTSFKKHPEYPNIGDRVVIMTNEHKHVNFGMNGTVIGTYKMVIEILFDEPFIGGTNLNGRCPPFRGGVVDFFDIFNITKWTRFVNKRSHLEETGQNVFHDEWDGNVDMMKLIGKMKEFKNQFENISIKIPRKKSNASSNKQKYNQGYQRKVNNDPIYSKKNNWNKIKSKDQRNYERKHKLKKTSEEYQAYPINQGNVYQKNNQYQTQHNLMNDLGTIFPANSSIPVYKNPAQIGNYQPQDDNNDDVEDDFQQTFYCTDNGRIPNRKRNHENKKRSGNHQVESKPKGYYRKKNN